MVDEVNCFCDGVVVQSESSVVVHKARVVGLEEIERHLRVLDVASPRTASCLCCPSTGWKRWLDEEMGLCLHSLCFTFGVLRLNLHNTLISLRLISGRPVSDILVCQPACHFEGTNNFKPHITVSPRQYSRHALRLPSISTACLTTLLWRICRQKYGCFLQIMLLQHVILKCVVFWSFVAEVWSTRLHLFATWDFIPRFCKCPPFFVICLHVGLDVLLWVIPHFYANLHSHLVCVSLGGTKG